MLRANIDLLQAQKTPDTAAVTQTLAEVRREAERLSRLVDDLLALSRADAGMVIVQEPIDLLDLAQFVHSQGRRWPGGHRLKLDLGDEPERWDWLVRGDEHLLQQLVLNLVDNALKYSPSDCPVVLRLSMDAPDTITLAIVDEGVGIPPAEHERIFERFYRGNEARASGAPGSGLGLCIARWIAEAHGGRLELASESGRGTTFRVRLPAWQPDPRHRRP
jgi:signal transduction histidine kinase